MDLDNNGDISEEEWMEFWQEVKRAGHSEEEIEEEVNIYFLISNCFQSKILCF